MSTQFDSSLFADVADTLGLGNPAIVEEDYYVVVPLKLINKVHTPYHQIVYQNPARQIITLLKSKRSIFREGPYEVPSGDWKFNLKVFILE